MTSKTGPYLYNNDYFFSIDPSFQPNSLQYIIKLNHTERLHVYNATPMLNFMGFLPIISVFSGSSRIYNAIKAIFNELSSKSNHDTSIRWNAIKNLVRGIVEITPLTGIILIIFETIRNIKYTAKVNKKIESNANIAVIAIKGKIITTLDLNIFDTYLKAVLKSQEEYENVDRLMCFKSICTQFVKSAYKRNKLLPLDKILTMIPNFFEESVKKPTHNV